MYNSIKTILLIFSFILIPGCSSSNESRALDIKQKKPFIIWSHSDIQFKKEHQRDNFADAVNDIAANVGAIDLAITAGDIVERGKSVDVYKSYLETRKIIKAGGWFTIAGNHEWRNIKNYKEYINPNLYYSVKTGNLIIIFLSNSEKGKQTVIPDRIFEWWKRKVTENQDKIIITVTHASLENSGLLQSKLGLNRQFIKNSDKFETVLKTLKVDLWISGHSHLPGFAPYSVYKNDDLYGTIFIDNGAIRNDTLSGMESRVIYLFPGSKKVIIRHRDHDSQDFSETLEKEYQLSRELNIAENYKIEIDDIAE